MSDVVDSSLRAMTDDGGLRAITVSTTELVRAALAAQGLHGKDHQETAAHFADMLTAAVLVRETMSPNQRVQALLRGAGGHGSIVADSSPKGATRGLVKNADGSRQVKLGKGTLLEVMRTMPNGELHRGITEVPAEATLSEAFTVYFKASEQVESMVSVGTLFDDAGNLLAAGGYLVQLLPELTHGMRMLMEERIKDFKQVGELLSTTAATPEMLMGELFYGMEHTLLDKSEVRFECGCSRVRVLTSLASLSREELESLIADGEILSMNCDYCGTEYSVEPEELKGLLSHS